MGDGQKEALQYDKCNVIRNVPFELLPRAFIDNLRGKVYDYDQFLQVCKFYNESGAYWNLLVYNGDGTPLAAVWGTWDPLEAHFRVTRVSTHPHRWTTSKKFIRYLFREVKLFASEMQAERFYWESDRWKTWLRKLDGLVFVDEMKVIQAY